MKRQSHTGGRDAVAASGGGSVGLGATTRILGVVVPFSKASLRERAAHG